MKPLIIYHKDCADGFGAAFAAWLKFGDEAEYLSMQYGNIPELQDLRDLVDGRDVYLLDFSLPRIAMDELFTSAKRVVWLDHHKGAFEMWCGGIPEDGVFFYQPSAYYLDEEEPGLIYLDNNRSGALIAWEYFHRDKEIPLMIEHIDDYDRWQFKLQGTKEFNRALWSYTPWSFEQWDKFKADAGGVPHNKEYLAFISEGAAILRAHDQNVTAIVKGAGRKCYLDVTLDNQDFRYIGLAANCPPHLASDAGHQLADQSGTYGLLWQINKDNKCVCSLRSNGDYDVSEIARAFGGGGHKNAAGFTVDVEILLGWIR